MRLRIIRTCRTGLLATFCVLIGAIAFGNDTTSSDDLPNIAARRAIAEARTLIHFDLVEQGDLKALDIADDAVSAALNSLKTASTDETKATTLRDQATALRSDIAKLRTATSGTFFGRFPLARLLVGVDSTDGQAVKIATIPDAARRIALQRAFAQSLDFLPGANMHAVVLVAREGMDDRTAQIVGDLVDRVAPSALATMPNLTLISNIKRSDLTAPSWDAPDAAFTECCRQIVHRRGHDGRAVNLCIMLVRALNPEPTDYAWYQVQWRAFYSSSVEAALKAESPSTLESTREYVGSGSAIDRSRHATLIVGCVAALFALALLLYVGLAYVSSRAPALLPEWILPPLLGFAIGFILPSLVAPVLDHLAPTATTPISHAAWWPALVGLLLFMAPAVAFNLGARSMTGVVPGLRCDGRWGLALMATGCGVTAFFARTAWLALGASALSILPALTFAACAVLYMFGRALDSTDRFPSLFAPVAALFATVLGVAAMAVEPQWIAGIGFVAMIIDCVVARRIASRRAVTGDVAVNIGTISSTPTRPQTLADLEARARTPEFQPSPSYIEAKTYLQKDATERTRWLALHGPSGSGKSAAATRLIADLRAMQPDARVLSGNCRSNAPPYQPFHDALGDIWESMSTPGPQATASGLDSVLQELVGAIVPYWSLLSGMGHSSGTSPGASGEFYSAVTASLKRFARKQPVILFLDNLQWIDEGSAALLRHLHQRLPPGSEARLTVLLCARDETPFQTSGIGDCVMQLNTPSRAEQVTILTEAFSIEPPSAQRIVDALGVLGDEPGGLFWLFQSVRELASAGVLQPTERGFAFRDNADSLPVPADLRRTLAEKLHASNDQKLILRSAALLGEVFSVTTLAETLQLDRLELLETLRQLEQAAHLVTDVPNDDDRYSFSSSFMFETVRDELVAPRLAGQRPPKLIQELHSRIATALERRGDPKLVFALARHWSQAGDRHAAKSFDCCMSAAMQARTAFTFDEARRWLSLAERSAQVLGKPFDAALERLRIDCDESHVTGRNRSATAESAWQLVAHRTHPNHQLLLLATRSCYDASRDTGDHIWCERGVALARRIIASTEVPLEQAAGYHLLGVSLPHRHVDERVHSLKKGLALVESDSSDGPERIILEAKLLSSLGEQLSYGDAEDRSAAKAYFERGLTIRTSHGSIDLPGQARAHGGLGRLALRDEPPDYDAARMHFVEDLKLSESIEDAAGVSMSEGALARCDRAAGDFASAAEHLRSARASAHGIKDVYFAIIGQLDLAIEMQHATEAEGFGRELAAMIERDAMPPSCAEESLRVLANVDADWAKVLIERLRSTEVAA